MKKQNTALTIALVLIMCLSTLFSACSNTNVSIAATAKPNAASSPNTDNSQYTKEDFLQF
jgi:hypothetical protein